MSADSLLAKRVQASKGDVCGPVTVIRPNGSRAFLDWKELWSYRELLYFLVWRDIKIRYKQTIIGFAWAVLQPAMMTAIFTLFFGILAGIPSGGVPYAVFAFTGLVPWTLFASGVTRASNSLLYDASLIQKVYFPRMLLPLANIISPVIDFLIAFVVLIALMLWFHVYPTVMILAVAPFLLLTFMFALGLGLWLSALNVEFRDVGQIVPVLVQLLFFASPIVYSSSFVPERYQVAYGLLNPMSGIVEGFRWAMLGAKPPGILILASAGIIVFVLASGVLYFRHRERAFADVV